MEKISFFILKVVIVSGLVLLVSVLGANWYIHFTQPSYQFYDYTVKIHNASSYGGSPGTDILVPLPMIGGETEIFTEKILEYETFGDWKPVLVMTDDGKMLALQSMDGTFTNVSAEFSSTRILRGVDDGGITSIDDLSLSPVIHASEEAPSSQTSGQCPAHALSLVYLPESIQPLSDNAPPLEIEMELLVLGSRFGSEYLGDYRLYGSVTVSADTRGRVPVPVRAFTRRSSTEEGGGLNWSCLS